MVTQGFYLWQPSRELLHPCTSTVSFLFQLYSSFTKIVTTALPELSPPGELFSIGNYTTASDKPVLISPCCLRCVVPYQRLHFLALNLTFSARLLRKEGKLWFFPLLPLLLLLSLSLSLSVLFCSHLRGVLSKSCQQSLPLTLRSHRHLILFFFFFLKQADAVCCKLPGALANLVVNDSHRECFSCPWRGFRHSWGRFATINYAQF